MVPATKTLYVLCGLPFSGKTTIARELTKNDALLIERDRFLEEMNRDPATLVRLRREALTIVQPISKLGKTREENAFNDALTRLYVARVVEAIRTSAASTIVVDGTHLQPLSRSFVASFPEVRRIAIFVNTDVQTCIHRFESAKLTGVRSTITVDLIRRMSAVLEPPTIAEGFDEIR